MDEKCEDLMREVAAVPETAMMPDSLKSRLRRHVNECATCAQRYGDDPERPVPAVGVEASRCSWLLDELRTNVTPGQPWPETVRSRVAEHLRSCEACREQFTRDWAIAQEMRVREDLDKRYDPDEIWRRIQAALREAR